MISNIYQLNLHRSPTAAHNLMLQHQKYHCMSLIQEPPVRKELMYGIPKPLHSLSAENSPRAAIVFNPSLDIWPLPQFSHRDCQAALWQINSRKVILISAYWAINEDMEPHLQTVLSYAKDKGWQVLLAIDTNGHHVAWFSNGNNRRGEKAYELFSQNNLYILNNSANPTYVSGANATNIDVTLTSTNLQTYIKSWTNLGDESFSDHKCLKTVVSGNKISTQTIPNYKHTPWNVFQSKMERIQYADVPLNSELDIDNAIEMLTNTIISTVKAITPKAKITNKVKPPPWWSDELRKGRRLVRVKFHQLQRNPSESNKHEYLMLRRQYQRELRQAKFNSWKEFTSETQNISDISKLTRLITKRKAAPIGMIKNEIGQLSTSGKQAILNLMNYHFPEINEPHSEPAPASGGQTEVQTLGQTTDESMDRTMQRITQVNTLSFLKELKPNKAPGPDGITNKTLQHLPACTIEFITRIMQNCIQKSFVPKLWVQSRVVFIPKGKDKLLPKGYRPICLSNSLFKILEKHIQLQLERLQIYPHKLSSFQHGFRNNHSTYTALSRVINYIELGLQNQEYTIAIFIDILGAFDNIIVANALEDLGKMGAPAAFTKILSYYYSQRTVHYNHQQIVVENKPGKGTAQGNVLSPMLWNIVVNKVGVIMEENGIDGCLFADDIVLLYKGKDIDIVMNKLQRVLDEMGNWANEQKLKVNLTKTHHLCFNGHLPKKEYRLFWGNDVIQRKDSTVYLGVQIMDNLNWTQHLKQKQAKAKDLMVQINQSLGKTWGPSPRHTLWAYTSVIRPKLTYACHIWAHAIPHRLLDNLSRQIQRWALTKLGPIREHTPTAGLEIVTHTPPLTNVMSEIAMKTIIRFTNIKFEILPALRGHLRHWQLKVNRLQLNLNNCDRMVKISGPDFNNYEENTSQQAQEGEEDTAFVYTDGSKIGKTPSNLSIGEVLPATPCYGSGFYLKWGDNERMGMSPNGNYFSVFLSEVRAITLAIHFLLAEKVKFKKVLILTDSTSALQAILKKTSTSVTVKECWAELQKLDKISKWGIQWIKGHSNIKGNDIADSWAKRAAERSGSQLVDFQRIAPDYVNKEIKTLNNAEWYDYWVKRPDCRQTKLWFHFPNRKKSKGIVALDRLDFGLMVRWMTGHCFLARHRSLIQPGVAPECSLCGEGLETPWHLLKECPMYNSYSPKMDWEVLPLLRHIQSLRFLETPELH